jgi:hypothetical protein
LLAPRAAYGPAHFSPRKPNRTCLAFRPSLATQSPGPHFAAARAPSGSLSCCAHPIVAACLCPLPSC